MLEQNITNESATRQYLAKITSASQRMTTLIRAVLEYSRAGDSQDLKQTVDLDAMLSDIKSDFELLLEERGVKITSSILPSVKGIPIQLQQLFANLISNAIKFSKDSPEITITASTQSINGEPFAKICVKDNGIGFNPDYAHKIFNLFHRLDSTTPGTGIGLALCKRIVQAHGGMITGSSTPGEGSLFEVLLPI